VVLDPTAAPGTVGKVPRRTILALTLAALGTILAGSLIGLSNKASETMGVTTFHQRLLACLGAQARVAVIEESSETCAREVLLVYADTRTPGEVHAALAELYRTDATFASVCHNISHYAGVLFARRDGAEAADLDSIASEICVTGILHGYLETVGFTLPDDTVVNDYIAACTSLRRELRIGCADAIGHLLYVRDPDLSRSAAKCADFPQTNEQIQCSYGVVMFAGQLLPGAYPDRADLVTLSITEVPAICAQWPVAGAVGQYGCGMGLANLLVFPSGAQREVAILAASGKKLGDDDPQAQRTAATLTRIYDTCLTLRSVPARLGCLNDSARNMSRTHEYQFADYAPACALLPQGYQAACPGEYYSLGPMHDAGIHLQVEAELAAQNALPGN